MTFDVYIFLGECEYKDKTGELNDKEIIETDSIRVSNLPINESDKGVDIESTNDSERLNSDSSDNNTDAEKTVLTPDQDEADKRGGKNSTGGFGDANKADNNNITNINRKATKTSLISLVDFMESSDSDSNSDIDDDNIEENEKLRVSKITLVEENNTNPQSTIDGPSTSGLKSSKTRGVDNPKSDIISLSSDDESSRLETAFFTRTLLYNKSD